MGEEATYSAGGAGEMGLIPGLGRSSKGGQATHSSILAWRIPWTEEPGRLQFIGSQRVGTTEVTKHTCTEVSLQSPVGLSYCQLFFHI